jgi:thioredoxin-related protein
MTRRLFLLALLLPFGLSAQTDSLAPYLRKPELPRFTLQTPDGDGILRSEDLDSTRPVMLMLFSPDCDHCHRQTEEITRRIGELGDLQIVMSTYHSLDMIRLFRREFQLESHPSIRVGRDVGYFLIPFFAARNVPLLAIYDRKRRLLEVIRGNVPLERILDVLSRDAVPVR